jgi:hypothetical protein
MPTYDVTVVVEYNYEVWAEDEDAAKEMGWEYEDYSHHAEVDTINVSLVSEDEDE